MLPLWPCHPRHARPRIVHTYQMGFGRVRSWVRERIVHGIPRGGERVDLRGGSVLLEVFGATTGKGGGGCGRWGPGGGGGGVLTGCGEEAEVGGFFGWIIEVCGFRGGMEEGVFVLVGHFSFIDLADISSGWMGVCERELVRWEVLVFNLSPTMRKI